MNMESSESQFMNKKKMTTMMMNFSSNIQTTSKGGWSAAIFIIFVEVAERFAYYGVVGNLIMYLTKELGEPVATAAKDVNVWVGVSALFPLLGGFIADTYIGRFKTIVISSIIYFLGVVLLTLSVWVVPTSHRKVVFFTALYVIAFGEGGHKPCVQTFAADQFDEESPADKLAKSSFFNWWYLGVVLGAAMAMVVVIYVQENISWTVGFAILAVVVAAALVLFLIGIPKYRIGSPVLENPVRQVVQVFVAAVRKWRVGYTDSDSKLCFDDGVNENNKRSLGRTSQLRFLDKATIIDDIDRSNQTRNEWRLCSVNQVEEVKLVLRLFPIWFNCMIFAIVVAQQTTFYTKQGNTMIKTIGTHFQVPAATLNVFTGLTIITTVLIYDRVFVPFARKITKHPSGITMLQRMGVGIFFSTITMIVAALVEGKRVIIAKENGLENSLKSVVPMKIWWMIPQYMLNGVSDAFTIVAMQELFYDQVPDKMRSMGAAAFISTIGIGSLMSGAVIEIVQEISGGFGKKWLGDDLNLAHLDYFYWVLAGLSGLNLCVFVWFAKGFVYKTVKLDESRPAI